MKKYVFKHNPSASDTLDKKPNPNSISGVRGVHKQGRKWRAKSIDGRDLYLGLFTTVENAEKAVQEFQEQLRREEQRFLGR